MDATNCGGRRRLAGRYALDRVVGHGAMGTVWAARDDLLGREVAVKEVLEGGGPASGVQEARFAARVVSPHVVRVHDLVIEYDRAWIVMQLLPGRTLEDVLADGPLAPPAAARIALDVLGALDAVHRAGVVHRDVKPSNVLLADDGRAVLVDFGIATSIDDRSPTSPAQLLGSPAFMPPERAHGIPSGAAGDIWSLGALLFTAVQGSAPYEREHPVATMEALLFEPVPAADRAGGLAPLVARMLSRNPMERPTVEQARRVLMLSLLRELDAPSTSHPMGPQGAPTGGPETAAGGEVFSVLATGVGDSRRHQAAAQGRGVRHAAAPVRRSARRSRSSW
jgi:serine/threonine protein kinase